MENNTDNTKNTKRWSKGGQNSLEDATNPHKIRAGGISAASIFPFLDLVFPIFPKISSKNFSEFFIPLHLPSGQIRR